MSDLYKMRDSCRLCGSKNLIKAVSLSPMQIATPNFSVLDEDQGAEIYTENVPLDLFLCDNCGHLQILCVGNREIQYTDYVYTTSSSLGLNEHFVQYSNDMIDMTKIKKDGLVIELGSNDGTMLQNFQKHHS